MLECSPMFDRLEPLLPEINLFLQNAGEFFTLKELKKSIGLKKIDDNVLGAFLISFSLAYYIPDPDSSDGTWAGKHCFFSGKEFPVQISCMERETGMFIPGSRFLPFLPSDKYAHDIKFFYEGKEIPKRKLYLTFDRISSFYFLYTENDISHVLCEDYEENVDVFSGFSEGFPPDSKFAVSFWDFSSVFDQFGFESPIRFFVRVKDWSNAEFEVLNEKPLISEEDISVWFRIFETSVKTALQILPMDSSTQEIVSFAYFLGESIIFSKKAAPLELFFEKKDVFGIVPYGIEEKFWLLNEPIKNPDRWFDYPVIEDAMAVFFESINRPVTGGMIKCFVLNFLSLHYMERFDEEIKLRFINEGLSLFIPKFMPDYKNISLTCKNYLNAYYDIEMKRYNPFKEDAAKDLRSALVYFYKNLLLFFNEIAERRLKTSDFDGQSPLMMYQIFDKIFQWSEFVASMDPEDYNFIEVMSMSLENLSYVYTDVKVEIRNKISALT